MKNRDEGDFQVGNFMNERTSGKAEIGGPAALKKQTGQLKRAGSCNSQGVNYLNA